MRPADLAIGLEPAGRNSLALEKRLLNPFDMIEIQMLVEGAPLSFTVGGRVAGVAAIRRVSLPQTSWGTPWKLSRFDQGVVLLSELFFFDLGLLSSSGERDS